ncbi:MAG: hypothetical protein JWR80_168, partial [Bradyrhizobium sp.]|nr:hypothetical protein [Bradyrhizobium sp.]
AGEVNAFFMLQLRCDGLACHACNRALPYGKQTG